MTNTEIYKDIATRTDGDIYIGIVGPVRTGKSTFIKQFMDKLVLPNIDGDYLKERANDELPQSSSGRTIMTTEPKFIPEKSAEICIGDTAKMNVRLIDCVGYIVPSALGYIEGDQPRMVMTPWYDEPIPFNMAAEIGTRKGITEHSTIGLLVTTDGSIGDISRDSYIEAEERVVRELKELGKPFAMILNSARPGADSTVALAYELEAKYGVPVALVSCMDLDAEDIRHILELVLLEFPVTELSAYETGRNDRSIAHARIIDNNLFIIFSLLSVVESIFIVSDTAIFPTYLHFEHVIECVLICPINTPLFYLFCSSISFI